MSRKTALLTGIGMTVFVCALFATVTAYKHWWNWSSPKKLESIQLGNEIVKELRCYHSDHGCFPENLQALVPLYLPSIPTPTAGARRWAYYVEPDKQTFRIQFSTPDGYPSMNYCSAGKDADWYEDN